MKVRWPMAGLFVFALFLPSSPAPGAQLPRAAGPQALPASIDADGDGYIDTVEDNLGSDKTNAASTPESIAIPDSCFDKADNDLDTLTDSADPGCTPPPVSEVTFPTAGTDAADSVMSLDGYILQTTLGDCPVDFAGRGPTIIMRGNPMPLGAGTEKIDTEMVAMQLTGIGTLPPMTPCNGSPSPVTFPATVFEDPAIHSNGTIKDTNPDPTKNFPADSFFDIFFKAFTPFGTFSGGPPGGPAGQPVEVTNVINTIPPYVTPENPTKNPNCYTPAGAPHEHCPEPPPILDHFKCYTTEFQTFTPKTVLLRDQFEQKTMQVVQPRFFCNPVSKNRRPIFNKTAHLKGYPIQSLETEPPFVPRDVWVFHQFGIARLTVQKPAALMTPTRKFPLDPPPKTLDHFKCYTVTGQPLNVTVRLKDQFHVEKQVTLTTPRWLCNPVEKTRNDVVTRIQNANEHLTCYNFTPREPFTTTITVRDQFRRDVGTVRRPLVLCLPSLKVPIVVKQVPPIDTLPVPQTAHTGEPIHDTAQVTGGNNPTGTVTFKLHGPGDDNCTMAPVFTDTVPLQNGSATSGNFTPQEPGTYHWVVIYNGDGNNDPSQSGCPEEPITITPPPTTPPPTIGTPHISTTPVPSEGQVNQPIHDTAQVTGGNDPTGTVTFLLYYGTQDPNCQTPIFNQTVALQPDGSASSPNFQPPQPGTYLWVAIYNGDTNDNTAQSGCNDEPVQIFGN